VGRPPARPIVFSQPTSIDLEPAGTLLLVENNAGRVLRVTPGNGRVSVLVPAISRPYAVVRAPSGSIYVSVGNQLQRLNASGAPTTVAEVPAGVEIGPIAAAPNGDVYYSTATQVFRAPRRLRAAGADRRHRGSGRRWRRRTGPERAALVTARPGVATDGALLVSDRDNDRVRRIDPATGVIDVFAAVGQPYGIDVAADGTVYVVEGAQSRVVRLSTSGARLGFVGPAFAIPYDVEVGGGVTYLLDAGPTGHIRRIGPNGAVTTISR
jgi:streptogramin lyase